MPIPVVQVHLDDVNNGGTWPYDISNRFRRTDGYTISQRGREDLEADPSAVVLALTLDNTDGGLTLGSSGGGYGTINLFRRVRVLVTANGVTTSRFVGPISSWPGAWPKGTDVFSTSQITASDALVDLQEITLRSYAEQEIIPDAPALYYTLGEPSGSLTAVDSSGNAGAGLTLNPGLGPTGDGNDLPAFGSSSGPQTDGLTALQFTGTIDGFLSGTTTVRDASWVSVAFTCANVGTVALDAELVSVWSPLGRLQLRINQSTGINPGVIYATSYSEYLTGPVVNDGAVHVATLVFDTGANQMRLYVDGALVNAIAPDNVAPASFLWGNIRAGQVLTGSLSHLVVGHGALPTLARIQAWHQAILTGFVGESTDQRLIRLLRYAGSTMTTAIEAGASSMALPIIDGVSVPAAIQQVADAEGGTAYVGGAGQLVFHNRYHAATRTTPALTISTDSDILDPSTNVLGDDQQVINRVEAKRSAADGATMVVQVAAKRRKVLTLELALRTDSEVLDRANWIIGTRSKPVPRISSLQLNLLTASAAVQAAVMALDVDDRIQITSMPSQSATGSVADLVIRGYAEALAMTSWTWTANVESWLDYEQAWILGDATYGVLGLTTRLGV